jgi:glycosyltransferase involved in cell wall biosynthesis
VRLVVYTDSVYRETNGITYGEIAFTSFLAALARRQTELTVIGRLDPGVGVTHYPLPSRVRFVGLPYYSSLTRPLAVISSLGRSLRLFWHALDRADRAWLFGPYLHALLFAGIALLRRRGVVLGVRQDFPAYVRSRRPTVRWMHVSADLLELVWRALARFCPVVVVGPELESHYRHALRVLPITVSLITDADVAAGERVATRSYDGELQLLSVGRLDEEKNPLLLADVLARLRRRDRRWRMVVCGDGRLQSSLAERLAALGLSESAELRGHVALHEGLLDLYRSSHVFLHVSWTEGLPQVLSEAFASALPVVATDVGGVAEAVGEAALLVRPGDAAAAADAVARVSSDAELRRRMVSAGLTYARGHTLQSELDRVAEFINAP